METLTVNQLNIYIKHLLEGDFNLSSVNVEGEISNYKAYDQSHSYFTLKDEKSRINCVFFKWFNKQQKYDWKNGERVIVSGYVSMYEKDGNVQLYVKSMKAAGIGELYIKYEELKNKLDKEGLFSVEYKKPIPSFPHKIGIVTAETGAAIRDILNIIKRRAPWVNVILYPSLVQGDQAAQSIIRGIETLDAIDDVDLIIIGRGGGSYEDLYAFNDEELARAVFNCKKPVISAVGHEIDFTISDFVSDMRAPTPSAAAELATPDVNELKASVNMMRNRMNLLMHHMRDRYRSELDRLNKRLSASSPLEKLNRYRVANSYNKKLLDKSIANRKVKLDFYVSSLGRKLEKYKPVSGVLSGIKVEMNGNPVIFAKSLKKYDTISIKFEDGDVSARVLDKIMREV